MPQTTTRAPQAEIRRFDVFAEWNRLKARHHHHWPEPQAQAYGLAVAKVVAARKFAGPRSQQISEWRPRLKEGSAARPAGCYSERTAAEGETKGEQSSRRSGRESTKDRRPKETHRLQAIKRDGSLYWAYVTGR